MSTTIPPLRYDIQIVPADEQQTQFYLYDPYGYAEQPVTISSLLLRLLVANNSEDAVHTVEDIPEEMRDTFHRTLTVLSTNNFLDDERFRKHQQQVDREYQQQELRKPAHAGGVPHPGTGDAPAALPHGRKRRPL